MEFTLDEILGAEEGAGVLGQPLALSTYTPSAHMAESGLAFAYSRDLTPQDLADAESGRIGSVPATLSKLRGSHHYLAKLLAGGMREIEAATASGYSQSRISILKNDPAFQQLLAFYQDQALQVHQGMLRKMSALTLDAMEVLQERLDETPQAFTNGQLLDIVKTGADRTEAPPVTKSVNVTENRKVDVQVLKLVKETVNQSLGGKFVGRTDTIIDVELSDGSPSTTQSD